MHSMQIGLVHRTLQRRPSFHTRFTLPKNNNNNNNNNNHQEEEEEEDTKHVPCFTPEGYKWAMAIAQSRSVFTDGSLRLIPYMDMCNHDDRNTKEATGGFMGTFGTTKGAELKAAQNYNVGDEVCCSCGPKSAADYLLEHGFCPPQTFKLVVSELTFELNPEDRFYDDKLDILEFETYDLAPMDPVQSFDIVSEIGRDGEPDPAMIQFVRLCQTEGTDSFLLESIFRKEVWGFMSLPVSEPNELAVTNTIIEAVIIQAVSTICLNELLGSVR